MLSTGTMLFVFEPNCSNIFHYYAFAGVSIHRSLSFVMTGCDVLLRELCRFWYVQKHAHRGVRFTVSEQHIISVVILYRSPEEYLTHGKMTSRAVGASASNVFCDGRVIGERQLRYWT